MAWSLMHHYLATLCIVLLSVPVDVWADCSRLKIFNGIKEDRRPGLCIDDSHNTECPSTLRPNTSLHVITTKYVSLDLLERPSEESVRVFSNPGVKLQWNPPISEHPGDFLQGFLLIFNDTTNMYCRRFGLNVSTFALSKQTTFIYDLDLPKVNSNYNIVLYSIIKSDKWIRTSFLTYNKTDPGFWRPSIKAINHSNGTLEVRFTLSPVEFGLTKFNTKLFRNSKDLIQNIIKDVQLSTTAEPEDIVYFTLNTDGNYTVTINAVDPYGEVVGRCLCWESYNGCRASCQRAELKLHFSEQSSDTASGLSPVPLTDLRETAIETQSVSLAASVYPTDDSDEELSSYTSTSTARELSPVPLISPVPPTSPVPATIPQDTAVENQSVNVAASVYPTDDSDGLTNLPVILAVLCSVMAATVVLIFLMRKKKCVVFGEESLWRGVSSPPPTLPPLQTKTTVTSEARECQAVQPSLRTKTLYVMSADDHLHHKQMVISFVKFLELHCYCKVIYSSTASDIHSHISQYAWFIRNIKDSDYIIFVCSKRAQKLVATIVGQDLASGLEFKPNDLFVDGFRYYLQEKEAREKTIKIVFGSDPKDCEYVTTSYTYTIPNSLPDFVAKVQSISEKDTGVYSPYLPLLKENIPSLQYGEELLEAIKRSTRFEHDNPDCLKENFVHSAEDSEEVEIPNSSSTAHFYEEHRIDNCINPKNNDVNSFITVPISVDDDTESVCDENVHCTMKSTCVSSESQGCSHHLLTPGSEDHDPVFRDVAYSTGPVCGEDLISHSTATMSDRIEVPEDIPSCCTGAPSINAQLTRINEMNE